MMAGAESVRGERAGQPRGAGRIRPRLEVSRRLNNRHIPWAFTDLVAAAIRCLPSRMPINERGEARAEMEGAVRGAEFAGAETWPEAARDLFLRCRAALADRVPVIPAGMIGPALDVLWPGPGQVSPEPATNRPAWLNRADCGDGQ